jgi:hypothetical protein
MMPSPTIPTLRFAISSLLSPHTPRRTLHGGFDCVQAQCAYPLRQGLSHARAIPYRRTD